MANLGVLVFWIILAANFISREWVEPDWPGKLACVSGVALGTGSWFFGLSWLVSLGHGKFSEKTLLRMEPCSMRSRVFSLNFPWPSDTSQLRPTNHEPVPSATPATQASLPGQSGATHSREMKFAARIIQKTSTPRWPCTRTEPGHEGRMGVEPLLDALLDSVGRRAEVDGRLHRFGQQKLDAQVEHEDKADQFHGRLDVAR